MHVLPWHQSSELEWLIIAIVTTSIINGSQNDLPETEKKKIESNKFHNCDNQNIFSTITHFFEECLPNDIHFTVVLTCVSHLERYRLNRASWLHRLVLWQRSRFALWRYLVQMRPKVLIGFLQFLQANAGTVPRLPTSRSKSPFANNPISKRYIVFNAVSVRDIGNFHLTRTEFGGKHGWKAGD